MPAYSSILHAIVPQVLPLLGQGCVASYIPELARVAPDRLGMALLTVDGDLYMTGDAQERFSVQSISKLFTLILAIQAVGEDLFQRVGKEPSGNPFNSLVQLEYERGIPRNPFINAGALVVTDTLLEYYPEAKQLVLDFVQKRTGVTDIRYDTAVYESEKSTGYINAALANYLKGQGNLHNPVEAVLDAYFHHCALSMNCVELARSLLFLANNGLDPLTGEQLLTLSQTKRLNALLLTCGFYDEAGEFAFRVGLPGKSGVGGGIVAVMPGKWSVAVWSPEINHHGNSVLGMKALELLTTMSAESIF